MGRERKGGKKSHSKIIGLYVSTKAKPAPQPPSEAQVSRRQWRGWRQPSPQPQTWLLARLPNPKTHFRTTFSSASTATVGLTAPTPTSSAPSAAGTAPPHNGTGPGLAGPANPNPNPNPNLNTNPNPNPNTDLQRELHADCVLAAYPMSSETFWLPAGRTRSAASSGSQASFRISHGEIFQPRRPCLRPRILTPRLSGRAGVRHGEVRREWWAQVRRLGPADGSKEDGNARSASTSTRTRPYPFTPLPPPPNPTGNAQAVYARDGLFVNPQLSTVTYLSARGGPVVLPAASTRHREVEPYVPTHICYTVRIV